jgi:predicted metalloprotease with PDZ domain
VRVTFRPVNGWRVATQLQPSGDPNTFLAPDLQYFMDSPTELSDFTLREWRMGPGDRFLYRMALHHTGSDAEADAYAEMARQVIAEQAAVFGEYPELDFGTYTFLADYLPWVFGDGMEHRNSTILASSSSLQQARQGLLGTLAHEHFHAWNMERLRDRDLEPFRFQEANMSSNLWFGEGFTSYYDALVRLRAGLMPLDDYVADMGRLLDVVLRSPARAYRGPADMSRMAPFTDAARSVDEPSFPVTFVSYYTWGEVLGFGLDLLLRRDHGTTLDAYMRLLWERFGRHQEGLRPARPYTAGDLRQALADLTGDAAFAEDFFRRYVESGEALDYASLAGEVGLLLRPRSPGQGSLGLGATRVVAAPGGGSGILLDGPLRAAGAAARAGLASGDLLLEVDGTALASSGALDTALAGKAPGATVSLTYLQTGARKTARVTLEADPVLELVTFERAGVAPTPEVRAAREAWAASRAR